MTTTAASVLIRAADTLADATQVRWTAPELCRYFNDGQRAIVELQPEASAITAPLALVAGDRQTLPADARCLLDVRSNTASKKAPRECSLKLLDAQLPGWRAMPQATDIKHFMFDDREPSVFHVYPPAKVGASLDIVYSAQPANISEAYAETDLVSTVTGNMALSDEYANALREYVLYRAFTKDGEHPANAARAASHKAAYMEALGLGDQAETANKPMRGAE